LLAHLALGTLRAVDQGHVEGRFLTPKISRRTLLSGALAAPYVTQAHAAADDHMIGEMLVLGFNGSTPDAAGVQGLARHLNAGRVGGVCFLGHNTRTRAGIEGIAKVFVESAARTKPLISVHQEGGAVQRLNARSGYDAIPTAQALASRGSPEEAYGVYQPMARTLRAAGFNLNLAPVVDLGFEPKNPVIAKWGRAYGPDGATVARYATAFVQSHRAERVLTAVKHFPGHGSTLGDSHERPIDLTPTWRPDELEPFRRMARARALDIVMTGHLAHAKLTGGEPATLSRTAIESLLRGDIGYQGAVMTDDLDIAAIRSSSALPDVVVRAIAAGNDIILLSNSLKPDANLPVVLIAAVKEAVAAGRIPKGRIEQSVERIARIKARV
jgi:beta-N-acetylhexosaminidase